MLRASLLSLVFATAIIAPVSVCLAQDDTDMTFDIDEISAPTNDALDVVVSQPMTP